MAGQHPEPRRNAPIELARGASVGNAVRAALASSAQRLIAHDPGVRLGADPEAVHQARVATRRLRSDLRTFATFLDPNWAQELRDQLRWLGRQLGAVRDVEVLTARLRGHARRLPVAQHLAVEATLARLHERWREARSELLSAIGSDSQRYAALLDQLSEVALAPVIAATADAPARAALPPLVRAPWRQLRDGMRGLGASPGDEALHVVRIRAKRCRYAAEAVAPVVGKAARTFAKRVTHVQEVLGEHQDAVVARDWLTKAAGDLGADEGYAAGMLAGLEVAAAAAARAELPTAWAALDRQQLRAWFR